MEENKGVRLIDSNGVKYSSYRVLAQKLHTQRGRCANSIAKKGYYTTKSGVTVKLDTDKVNDVKQEEKINNKKETKESNLFSVQDSNLLIAIKNRYSDKEIEYLLKGEGVHNINLKYPTINLAGKHHKIGVMSDGHIGSIYSPRDWHYAAFDKFDEEKVDCVLHCGDVVEGVKISRFGTQIWELSEIGYKAQKAAAIEVFSRCKQKIYCISGNHDFFFQEYTGADIVEDICSAVPNMTYLGNNQADIVIDGAIVRLFHGGDGSSYATSYRLQKLIESITGGKKPNIFLAGHVHKMCYLFERMVHAVSVPALQMQTSFMQKKKLAAHTGFLIIEFDTNPLGVANFSVRNFPFYA